MNWLLFLFLSLILFFTPYQRGLFFDTDFYVIEGFLLAVFFVWLITATFNKKINIPNAYYIVFTIPLLYLLLFTVAETPKGNFDNLLRWLTYCSFFCLLVWLRKNQLISKTMSYIFQATGIAIACFSLMGLWGWVEYRDIVLSDRLTGPFQYANTFAAVVGAFWLYSLVSLLKKSRKSVLSVVMYSAPLIVYGVIFLHSYSRGALIILPIAWFIGLVLLRLKEQIWYFVFTLLSFAGSVITFRILIDQRDSVATPGWLPLVISTLVIVGISVVISRLKLEAVYSKFSEVDWVHKYGSLLLSVGIVFVGILLWLDVSKQGLLYQKLPESFQQRIDEISLEEASATARTGMFEDALAISKESPIIGFGGEGWKVVYFNHQTKPYYSNEVHNGYLEILLNSGWLGLVLFMAVFVYLFAAILWKWYRTEKQEVKTEVAASIAALAMIFIHSIIDFNFSYGTVWLLIIWLLATNVPLDEDEGLLKIPGKLVGKIKVPGRLDFLGKLVLACFVLFGVIYSVKFYQADQKALLARGGVTLGEWERIIGDAYSLNPYNVEYGISLAKVYKEKYLATKQDATREKLIGLLNELEARESQNANLLFQIGHVYAGINDWETSIKYFNKAINADKYNVEFYNTLIDIESKLGQYYSAQGDNDKSIDFAQDVISNYKEYMGWYNAFKNQNVPDRRPLEISKETHIQVAKAHLLLNESDYAFEKVKKLNPSIESGIYDAEKDRLLTSLFGITTLGEVMKQYSDQIIILSVKDEAVTNMPDEVISLMEQWGSNINALKVSGSYVGVIVNRSVALEQINNKSQITINEVNRPKLRDIFPNKSVTISSAGINFGNTSSILVDGIEYSQNKRGMNIAIFDKNLNNIASYNFDTYVSDIAVYKKRFGNMPKCG